ncbi:MAG: dihydrofolate reductase, partial [Desulfobacterota bacterium]|nr:dihydrofolate reductase [Thermodesulfobacteriota bacterium]
MYRVLISAPYLQRDFEAYRGEFVARGIVPFLPRVVERLEEPDLLAVIADYDGIICGDDRITARVIDAAVRLKVIVKWGTGIDSIDKVYAASKGIPVFNTPNAFTEPVSDSVLALMLSFARQIIPSDRILKQGGWDKRIGFCLCEKTLGVIGIGNIGRAVARKARGFGMRILGNDIKEIPATVTQELGIIMVSLERLLREADIISINCDLNPTSYHLISERQFALMKPDAIIINTAR